jgi:hypothetical protein
MAQLDITAAWGGQPGAFPARRTAEQRVPAIDFDAAGGVDLDRLERSLQLDARRVGDGRYHVKGGSHDHWVDLYSTSVPRCDCGDHLWREQLCKHILAALLREGNDRVVSALGRLFARLKGLPQAA